MNNLIYWLQSHPYSVLGTLLSLILYCYITLPKELIIKKDTAATSLGSSVDPMAAMPQIKNKGEMQSVDRSAPL